MAKKSVYVIISALILPLLGVCVFSPGLSIPVLPAFCALLYFVSLRAGWWLFAPVAAVYFAAGTAVWGIHPFVTAGACVILLLTVPRLLRRKLNYAGEVALCAAAGFIAVCAVFGVWAAATRTGADGVIMNAYVRIEADPVVSALSRKLYRTVTSEQLGHVPYSVRDELYLTDAVSYYATSVWRELDGTVMWYLSGFGTFAGGVAALGGCAMYSCMYKDERVPVPVKDWRLGRGYVFAAVLPALAFAFLAFYEPMKPVAIAVVNVMVTLPCTMCGITLLYHSVSRINGKAGAWATVLFWTVTAVAAFFYEWGMLIIGFVGLADALINVRKLLDWALS